MIDYSGPAAREPHVKKILSVLHPGTGSVAESESNLHFSFATTKADAFRTATIKWDKGVQPNFQIPFEAGVGYVQLCRSTSNGKTVSDEQAHVLSALWMDADVGPGEKKNATPQEAFEATMAVGWTPSLVWRTSASGGVQAVWPLDSEVVGAKAIAQVLEAWKWFLKSRLDGSGLKFDEGVANSARWVRCFDRNLVFLHDGVGGDIISVYELIDMHAQAVHAKNEGEILPASMAVVDSKPKSPLAVAMEKNYPALKARLLENKWKLVDERQPTTVFGGSDQLERWTHPAATSARSATVILKADGTVLLHTFTDSTLLPAGRCQTNLRACAILDLMAAGVKRQSDIEGRIKEAYGKIGDKELGADWKEKIEAKAVAMPVESEEADEIPWEERKAIFEAKYLVQSSGNDPKDRTSYAVQDMLYGGETTLLVGAPGVGKTTLAMSIAVDLALGRKVFGKRVDPSGALSVLLIGPSEGSKDRLIQMRSAAILKRELSLRDVALVEERVKIIVVDFNLEEKSESDDLARWIGEINPTYAHVDSLRGFSGSANESKAEEIGKMVRFWGNLARRYNIALTLCHHSKKDDGKMYAGSSAITSQVDNVWALTRGGGIGGDYEVTLEVAGKARSSRFSPISADMSVVPLGAEEVVILERSKRNPDNLPLTEEMSVSAGVMMFNERKSLAEELAQEAPPITPPEVSTYRSVGRLARCLAVFGVESADPEGLLSSGVVSLLAPILQELRELWLEVTTTEIYDALEDLRQALGLKPGRGVPYWKPSVLDSTLAPLDLKGLDRDFSVVSEWLERNPQ